MIQIDDQKLKKVDWVKHKHDLGLIGLYFLLPQAGARQLNPNSDTALVTDIRPFLGIGPWCGRKRLAQALLNVELSSPYEVLLRITINDDPKASYIVADYVRGWMGRPGTILLDEHRRAVPRIAFNAHTKVQVLLLDSRLHLNWVATNPTVALYFHKGKAALPQWRNRLWRTMFRLGLNR